MAMRKATDTDSFENWRPFHQKERCFLYILNYMSDDSLYLSTDCFQVTDYRGALSSRTNSDGQNPT